MTLDADVVVGDWVCFQYGGHIVYGRVQYVRRTVLGYWDVVTTAGTVTSTAILECRRVSEPQP